MLDRRDIAVLILAGGLGTRLRPALADCPKVLAPVGGRPFITYLLDQLAEASFEEVVLLTGYGADLVRVTLGASYRHMSLMYSCEPSPLGTGGALRQALPRVGGRTVLLLNGDSYCEIDLPRFVAHHRQRRADLSMVLANVPDTSRFGAVQINNDGRINQFVEKQAVGPGSINAGMYLVETLLLDAIPPGQAVSLERELLPSWLYSRRLFGFPSHGRFLDIGTPASYAEAKAFFAPRAAHAGRLALTA